MVKPTYSRFLPVSDKAKLGQVKIRTAPPSTSLSQSFHAYPWSTRKEKFPVLSTCAKSHQLNQIHQNFLLKVSLVFRRFSCVSCRNGLQMSGTYLKKYELCRLNYFCPELEYWYICAQAAVPQNFI